MVDSTLNSSTDDFSLGAKKIIDAAETLFADRGFHGVSIQDIAKAALVSKANVYHHFRSKDELYYAVINRALEEMSDLLNQLSQTETSAINQFAQFSQEHLKHLNHKPHIAKLVLRELLDGSNDRCRDLAQQVFNGQYLMLKEMMKKAQKSDLIRLDMSPEHMAVALVGLNVFLFQCWPALQHFPDKSFQNQAESGTILFELLLNGLMYHGEQA